MCTINMPIYTCAEEQDHFINETPFYTQNHGICPLLFPLLLRREQELFAMLRKDVNKNPQTFSAVMQETGARKWTY